VGGGVGERQLLLGREAAGSAAPAVPGALTAVCAVKSPDGTVVWRLCVAIRRKRARDRQQRGRTRLLTQPQLTFSEPAAAATPVIFIRE
jgi:hypothetical protein